LSRKKCLLYPKKILIIYFLYHPMKNLNRSLSKLCIIEMNIHLFKRDFWIQKHGSLVSLRRGGSSSSKSNGTRGFLMCHSTVGQHAEEHVDLHVVGRAPYRAHKFTVATRRWVEKPTLRA